MRYGKGYLIEDIEAKEEGDSGNKRTGNKWKSITAEELS